VGLTGIKMDLMIYFVIYTLLSLFYLWYKLTLYFANLDYGGKEYPCLMSVIIPVYNEDFNILKNTIINVYKAKGNKEIFVVDDGSTNGIYEKLKRLRKEIPFNLHRFKKNKGKRYAQTYAMRKSKGDIIITIDSDTWVQKNALVELVKPFWDKEVGATTGRLKILNKDKNLLTKMIDARYWIAFNVERAGQSAFNIVNCCSGPLSAYRREYIIKHLKEYENQKFLGKRCTYGDDRHLTTLILKKYKVKYVPKAIAYTMAQENLKNFIKQQIRWKKSFIRETILVSKFMFKRSLLLSFDIIISFFLPILSLLARIFLIILPFFKPIYFLWFLFIISFMAFMHSFPIIFTPEKDKLKYIIMYGFLHTFVVYWLFYVALFNLNKNEWGTR